MDSDPVYPATANKCLSGRSTQKASNILVRPGTHKMDIKFDDVEDEFKNSLRRLLSSSRVQSFKEKLSKI